MQQNVLFCCMKLPAIHPFPQAIVRLYITVETCIYHQISPLVPIEMDLCVFFDEF